MEHTTEYPKNSIGEGWASEEGTAAEKAIDISDRLEAFLYLLLRDVAPAGDIIKQVQIVEELCDEHRFVFTNKHLQQLASHLVDRICNV